MATIDENRQHWSAYDWSRRGEEWSEVWGGSQWQWEGSVWPRISRYLEARLVLEIACGFGRWSRYLRPHCDRLVLVDITAEAVEACRALFAGDAAVSCHRNDGANLPMVEAGTVDFAFSLDSLVHCEAPVLQSYLRELAVKLAPAGVAFLHHSNFARVLADRPTTYNHHWRAESVSAELVASVAIEIGLVCVSQEIVDWGGVPESDCFTILARSGSLWAGTCRGVTVNPYFMGEAMSIGARARLYPPQVAPFAPASRRGGAGWHWVRRLRRWLRCLPRR